MQKLKLQWTFLLDLSKLICKVNIERVNATFYMI